jgi:ribosomal protein L31
MVIGAAEVRAVAGVETQHRSSRESEEVEIDSTSNAHYAATGGSQEVRTVKVLSIVNTSKP